MGRPRAYDEDAALTAAMHAFRRKGYSALSVREIETATRLKTGSLYNSFGDKAGLFAAAFAHYNRTVLRRRIAEHAPEARGLTGLRRLFLSLLREPNDESFGCLITNAAIELGGGRNPPPGVKEAFQVLSEAFARRLSAARASGALRAGIDPAVTAQRLLALYQGILVLVRAGYDKRAAKRIINDEFNALERTP